MVVNDIPLKVNKLIIKRTTLPAPNIPDCTLKNSRVFIEYPDKPFIRTFFVAPNSVLQSKIRAVIVFILVFPTWYNKRVVTVS